MSKSKQFMRNITLSLPILLAGIILIGTTLYRLVYSDNISEDIKKKLSYAEIPLSFVVSLFMLTYLAQMAFFILFGLPYSLNNIYLLFYLIFLIIFTTPFIMTCIRAIIQEKININYHTGFSVAILLSTLYNMSIILKLFVGI